MTNDNWPYDLGYKFVESYYDVNDFIYSASLPEIIKFTIVSKDDKYYQVVSTVNLRIEDGLIVKDYNVNDCLLEVFPVESDKSIWLIESSIETGKNADESSEEDE